MKKTIFITSKFRDYESLEARPHEDFGFDYEEHEAYHFIGDDFYDKTDVGLVSIDVLINNLLTMQKKGANYVACDWHVDHEELELYGFKLTASTSDEIQNFLKTNFAQIKKLKEDEIAKFEKTLEILKKDLEKLK